jgi:hypothetical protein
LLLFAILDHNDGDRATGDRGPGTLIDEDWITIEVIKAWIQFKSLVQDSDSKLQNIELLLFLGPVHGIEDWRRDEKSITAATFECRKS